MKNAKTTSRSSARDGKQQLPRWVRSPVVLFLFLLLLSSVLLQTHLHTAVLQQEGGDHILQGMDQLRALNVSLEPPTAAEFYNYKLNDLAKRERALDKKTNDTTTKDCAGKKSVQAKPIHLPETVSQQTRPPWCLDVPITTSGPFYLGMIIHARVYPDDKPKLTTQDLAHWLTYHRYAGVERVYLFDTYINETEKLTNDPAIQSAIASGFVQYTDYHKVALADTLAKHRSHLVNVQKPAFRDGQNLAENETRWCGFLDMDEYASVMGDERPGFFARYLEHKEQAQEGVDACKRVTQYKMQNYIAQGGREYGRGPMLIQQVPRIGRASGNTLIQQVPRIGRSAGNTLMKQLVRTDAAKNHDIHTSALKFGSTLILNASEIVMKHFWGGRALGWRRVDELPQDERETLYNKTIPNDMGKIPEQVLRCF